MFVKDIISKMKLADNERFVHWNVAVDQVTEVQNPEMTAKAFHKVMLESFQAKEYIGMQLHHMLTFNNDTLEIYNSVLTLILRSVVHVNVYQ